MATALLTVIALLLLARVLPAMLAVLGGLAALVALWLLWQFAPEYIVGFAALLVLGAVGTGIVQAKAGEKRRKARAIDVERMRKKLRELDRVNDKESVYHACLLRRRLEAADTDEEFTRVSQEVEARWESERRMGAL